jgi:diguanylate cyclase (GGDEF)-like protein
MDKESYSDILNLCLTVNAQASVIYDELAGSDQTDDLKRFWSEMSSEEKALCGFWRKLLDRVEHHPIPKVFDDPESVLHELTDIRNRAVELRESYHESPEKYHPFVLALRMEYYLLHPAFETLYHFAHTVSGEENPGEHYDVHLNRLIDMIHAQSSLTPEIELLSDIMQKLWAQNRELALQSNIDELTGVFNRQGFFNALQPLAHLAQRSKSNVGFLLGNLDNMKAVNENFGQGSADAVLRRVANILRYSTRTSDILGRYGGDTFIIMLTPVNENALFDVAERIRASVEEETANVVPVTISIGLAQNALQGDTIDAVQELVEKADACLRQAKQNGKNQVVLYGASLV